MELRSLSDYSTLLNSAVLFDRALLRVIVMQEPTRLHAEIVCDVCGSHTQVLGFGQQFGTLQASWGYGSQHDGEVYRVHLCEPCFFCTLANLRREQRIHTMFDDDQPADEHEFGRIARDNFFGDV